MCVRVGVGHCVKSAAGGKHNATSALSLANHRWTCREWCRSLGQRAQTNRAASFVVYRAQGARHTKANDNLYKPHLTNHTRATADVEPIETPHQKRFLKLVDGQCCAGRSGCGWISGWWYCCSWWWRRWWYEWWWCRWWMMGCGGIWMACETSSLAAAVGRLSGLLVFG